MNLVTNMEPVNHCVYMKAEDIQNKGRKIEKRGRPRKNTSKM